jgi:predicted nucleic acid-binding protein
MSGKFFLDTNLFVYSFDEVPAPKARCAIQLIRQAVSTRKGIISYQVVQEFLNVALRRFDHPMRVEDAEQYLAAVLRPLLVVHSSPALFSEALHIAGRHSVSWYDSLIIAAALQAQCEVLYSEDFQHGRKFGELEIRNPFL